MIQYWIQKQSSIRFMRDLYRKFLTEDKDWHFFYEDIYMLLRLKERSRSVEKYLESKKILYTRSVWTDAHAQVRKYQDLFKEIFHAYSVLAMKITKKEHRGCLNRVIHCFCNMNWGVQKRIGTDEVTAVAGHLFNAAYNQGVYAEQYRAYKRNLKTKRKTSRKK